MKNRLELTELYNKADVIQLPDFFEKSIEVSMSEFGINHFYHISLPVTTWSNGLRYARAELELIKDVDLFHMSENGIRSGINGLFGNRYIASDTNHKILYVDQNNLCGNAMSQYLPTGNFQIYENK